MERQSSKGFGLRLALAALVIGAVGAPLYAVTTYDLTAIGSSQTINGAIFTPFDPDTATGTGVLAPFVRVQADGTEAGYNTAGTVQPDVKGGTWTHSLLLSDVPAVNEGDTWYREFLLDANQSGSSSLLSIDQLIIRLEATGDIEGPYADNFSGPIVYNLDGVEDSSLIIHSDLFASGSGTGDVRLLVPNSAFADSENEYVYLYSLMGGLNPSNDGFEEWGVRVGDTPPPPPPAIPAPGAILLTSLGIGLVGWLRQRKSL